MKPMVVACTALLVAALAAGVACASGGGRSSTERTRCALRPTDSVFTRGGPVYRECAVDREALLLTGEDWEYVPPEGTPGCYRVRLEYVVGTNGAVEIGTVRTVSSNSPAFAKAVIASVPQWKYDPARIAGAPVRQIVVINRTLGVVVTIVPAGSGPPSTPRDPC